MNLLSSVENKAEDPERIARIKKIPEMNPKSRANKLVLISNLMNHSKQNATDYPMCIVQMGPLHNLPLINLIWNSEERKTTPNRHQYPVNCHFRFSAFKTQRVRVVTVQNHDSCE